MHQFSTNLLNYIPDIVLLVDSAGEILSANSAITSLLGYQPSEVVGKTVEYLLPERYRDKHVSIRNSYYKHSSTPRLMNSGSGLWAKDKQGIEIPVSIELNSFKENGNHFFVCSIRTLTEKELIVTALHNIQEGLEFSQ